MNLTHVYRSGIHNRDRKYGPRMSTAFQTEEEQMCFIKEECIEEINIQKTHSTDMKAIHHKRRLEDVPEEGEAGKPQTLFGPPLLSSD